MNTAQGAVRAATASVPSLTRAAAAFRTLNGDLKPYVSHPDRPVSEWGDHTLEQPTVRPAGLWPGTQSGLPLNPRAYADVKSYHAHFYFDYDSYQKAALIRRWVGVNAYEMKAPRDNAGNTRIEQIVPNIIPTLKLES